MPAATKFVRREQQEFYPAKVIFCHQPKKKKSKGSMSQLIHANSQVKKAILDDQR